MTLTFPCMAEQAAEKFKIERVPLNRIVKAMGADRDDRGSTIVWLFPDDTKLIVTGRGRHHSLEIELP